MIDYLQRDKDLDNLITVIDNLSRLRTGSTFMEQILMYLHIKKK